MRLVIVIPWVRRLRNDDYRSANRTETNTLEKGRNPQRGKQTRLPERPTAADLRKCQTGGGGGKGVGEEAEIGE